ncbi:hypothetical protein OG21DRAFT_1427222 [Imleria badia]|nr:hypothetical protein OG21DRAFT_1427222 [Imleria badia]
MPFRPRPTCVVCQHLASKYTCASCRANYCSVVCYKTHKDPQLLQDPLPLRPLTALKWPYVPDVSAYPDPLTRDDPKPLQMHQYEAIATSPTIRTLLSNPRLCTLLTTIDALRGPEREEALQRALGVDSRLLKNHDDTRVVAVDEDTKALRALAEAVEGAVRGGREDMLGLDWD